MYLLRSAICLLRRWRKPDAVLSTKGKKAHSFDAPSVKLRTRYLSTDLVGGCCPQDRREFLIRRIACGQTAYH